ncbi:ATP-dependent DNA ligase [Gorillibacterium massiliense]|uniref:ATP-dependent DNA ligase n=1 Tax=Gorillibacterium massiliense TaxID=1280390 RepID=UPI0004B39478|nr:RNA ligase family protein [Gorillibacterium massiliense]
MPFTPIAPFEPVSADKPPNGDSWTAQIKWDGVRILTYYDGSGIRLFNRRLNERTLQYPELQHVTTYSSANSLIIDGEMIALQDGKPSFHQIMKRDSLRTAAKIAATRRNLPVAYMIFDILYCNGEWVTGLSLRERQLLLQNIILPNESIQLVQNFPSGDALFQAAEAHGLEGIVMKDLNSIYVPGGKDKRWQKIKSYQDTVAVIGGATFRHDIVNAVLLGLYNEQGQLLYIGHAGTGKLSVNDWRQLTERIKPLIIPECPFANTPERSKDAVWLAPRFTAKIRFLEWTENGTMRQPSIQALVDLPPQSCVFE